MFDRLPDENESLAAQLPAAILEGLRGYGHHGYPVGHFLTAVLANDLMQAVGRADPESLLALKPICQFVYNCLPSGSHGSVETVRDWIAHCEHVRQQAAELEGVASR